MTPSPPLHDAYLAFGANLGDRVGAIRAGTAGLTERGVELVGFSSLYTSRPKYLSDQPAFINGVGLFQTGLDPRALLAVCQAVEAAAGRQARVRYGPRELDIDILLYDDLTVQESDLIIPHPALTERLFVLVPLVELAPSLEIPGQGPVRTLLDRARTSLPARENVRRIGAMLTHRPDSSREGGGG